MTPLRAIRAKCLDCCCGQSFEVRRCSCEDCSFHQYRFGHNPKLAGRGNIYALTRKSPTQQSKQTINDSAEGDYTSGDYELKKEA